MIRFKVIDTVTGAEAINQEEYVVNNDGTLNKLTFSNLSGLCNGWTGPPPNHKAAPSIVIDGVEYYHGQVVKRPLGGIYVVRMCKYSVTVGALVLESVGWNAIAENEAWSSLSSRNEFIDIGNVWQKQHKHLMPLLEGCE